MATCQDLSIDRGRSKDYVLTFTDSSGTAIDITGYTVFFTVKPKPDTDITDADAVITKTVTSHTNPTGGVSTVSLSASDTRLTTKDYYYDISYKDTSGDVYSVQEGKYKISSSITNRTA